MQTEIEKYKSVRDELNKTGTGFCLAKWTSLHLNLNSGTTNSCHHPSPHKIPLNELADSPTALHNTTYKNSVREQMLAGKRPDECQYCWNIEDLSTEHVSDRHMKSSFSWSLPHMDQIKNDTYNNIPTYLEVMFSNTCNYKCSYCSPQYSSRWVEEIESKGPYPTSHQYGNTQWLKDKDIFPIHRNSYNPYVDAFWEWWPQLKSNLHTMRITGGEPLLDDNTFGILDEYIDEPNDKLILAINSNLGVPDKIIDKLINKIQLLEKNKSVKGIEIYTSIDGYKSAAEYARFGMNYENVINNIDKILSNTNCKITIMCTFNIFSFEKFDQFIVDVHTLKIKHIKDDRKVPLLLSVSILRHPNFLSPTAYRHLELTTIETSVAYMKNNQEGKNGNDYYYGFFDFEIEQLERLLAFALTGEDQFNSLTKSDFYRFVMEHDNRRGTNIYESGPSLIPFINICKAEDSKRII